MKPTLHRFSCLFFFAITTAALAQSTPTITSISRPRQCVTIGQPLTLTVTANGSPAPAYQWKRNGRIIPNATSASYTIASASPVRDNGWYQVTASNDIGSATSAVVFVNVAVYPARILIDGNYNAVPSPVPSGLTSIVSVAAGAGHWLALKADGTVAAWGDNTYGQATVPRDLNDVVSIAANTYASFALKADGSVVAWGDGSFGQTAVSLGATKAVSIAAGQAHALALRPDGTVVGWGWNQEGQASPPARLANIVGISAGQNNSFAWRADGTAVGWGNNGFHQTSLPADLSGVIAIASGEDFSIALKSDGTVQGWGNSYSGGASVPVGLTNVVSIAAGIYHALALKADNSVVEWGETYTGPAALLPAATNVVAIAAQDAYSAFLCRAAEYAPATAQTIAPGGTAVLVASRNGSLPSTFQWTKDGVSLSGATNPKLIITGASTVNTGNYACNVTDINGTYATGATALTVSSTATVSRIANISTRALAGTDPQTLILGIVTRSSSTNTRQPILFRAVGPSLSKFDVTGLLADPKLELFSGQTKIMENEDWSGDAQVETIGGQVGAFPLGGTRSKDAALYVPAVAPGLYTMLITGAGGATGVALAEIYDATPMDAIDSVTPRFVNASARAQVGTGSGILIVGFVITGETSKTLLIRAVGPSLAGYGVSDVLPNPKLELYSGSSRVRENDDWGTDAAANAVAFKQVGAFSLVPDSKDSALLITLPPGVYTTHVSGVNNSTGVALLELYDLP